MGPNLEAALVVGDQDSHNVLAAWYPDEIHRLRYGADVTPRQRRGGVFPQYR